MPAEEKAAVAVAPRPRIGAWSAGLPHLPLGSQMDRFAQADGTPFEVQLDMLGAPQVLPCGSGADVRAEIMDILEKARAMNRGPWDAIEAAQYRRVLSEMAEGLPVDEAAQLRLELEAGKARIKAA